MKRKVYILLSVVSFLTCSRCFGGRPLPLEVVSNKDATAPFLPTQIPVMDLSECTAWRPWSSSETWGGQTPPQGAEVVIPSSICVELDQNVDLTSLTIHGALRLSDELDIQLNAGWIKVEGGAFVIGEPNLPHLHRAEITLNAPPGSPDVMPGMGTRGLYVVYGQMLFYGRVPNPAWTKLGDHYSAGASSVVLSAPASWQIGDELVFSPTDFFGISETEQRTVTATDSSTVTVNAPLAKSRWGRMQFVALTEPLGLSETTTGFQHNQAPVYLDERAETGNLTRNIIIAGAIDTAWTQAGFGAHVMIMGLQSRVAIDGVRLTRVGQAGILGRYPVHWHMLSVGSVGQELGDANSAGRMHILKNSAIVNSANRCITIHGTSGLVIQNNICYDIKGHAIFFEDAVERRNLIEDNLILRVREPMSGKLTQNHDRVGVDMRVGPSGFWITNPDNIIRRNVVADASGSGYWYAVPSHTLGHPNSKAVNLTPRHLSFGSFEDNIAHSIYQAGLLFDLAPIDQAGNVTGVTYQPTLNNAPATENNPLSFFTLKGFVSYKNREGFWNRLNGGRFEGFVSADNTGKFFAGSSAFSELQDSLVIGTSLNRENTWETVAGLQSYSSLRAVEPPLAFASYHGGLAIFDNVVVNMPVLPDNGIPVVTTAHAPSGVFGTDDYYLRPIERSLAQNFNNYLINSHPGARSLPNLPSFVFAGAIKDYTGLWGPAGNYWVFDNPFLTADANCANLISDGASRSCDGEFFGAEFFVLDKNSNEESNARMQIQVSRRSSTNPDQEIGLWNVAQASHGTLLGNMRHFAMRQDGVYVLRFPTYVGMLLDIRMVISNMHSPSDTVVLAVHYKGQSPTVYATTFPAAGTSSFSGPLPSNGYPSTPNGNTRVYTSASSRDELINTSAGDQFWTDGTNNLVWIKIRGGLADAFISDPAAFSDETLYKPFYLRIR